MLSRFILINQQFDQMLLYFRGSYVWDRHRWIEASKLYLFNLNNRIVFCTVSITRFFVFRYSFCALFQFFVTKNKIVENDQRWLVIIFLTVKTTGLYHVPFKTRISSPESTYFMKWIIVRSCICSFLLGNDKEIILFIKQRKKLTKWFPTKHHGHSMRLWGRDQSIQLNDIIIGLSHLKNRKE